jgi:hypothetical protein
MATSKARERTITKVASSTELVKPISGFEAINARIDSLYQGVEDGDPAAAKKLQSLATVVRLKIALANFKKQNALRG